MYVYVLQLNDGEWFLSNVYNNLTEAEKRGKRMVDKMLVSEYKVTRRYVKLQED